MRKPRYRYVDLCGHRTNLSWREARHYRQHLKVHLRMVLERMKAAHVAEFHRQEEKH